MDADGGEVGGEVGGVNHVDADGGEVGGEVGGANHVDADGGEVLFSGNVNGFSRFAHLDLQSVPPGTLVRYAIVQFVTPKEKVFSFVTIRPRLHQSGMTTHKITLDSATIRELASSDQYKRIVAFAYYLHHDEGYSAAEVIAMMEKAHNWEREIIMSERATAGCPICDEPIAERPEHDCAEEING